MRKQISPLNLTGRDLAHFLQEERDDERRLKDRLNEDEDRRDFNESQKAVDAGREYTDFRGKRIRGRGRYPLLSAIYPYSAGRTVADEFANTALIAMSWSALFKGIQQFYAQAAELATAAVASSAPAKPRYEDTDYIYDEIKVSRATCDQLEKEQQKVLSLTYQMAALDINADPLAPWKENDLWDKRKTLLDEFGMRAVPDTNRFAHNYERVLKLEDTFNPHGIAQAIPVMVYVPKVYVQDGMRVYAKVGDAFNNDPAEAIATGDHLKVETQTRPIPPPAFRHS